MQHASIASAQARLNAGQQAQNMQSLSAGAAQSSGILSSAQQMNQALPQTDFQQGSGDGSNNTAPFLQSQNANFGAMGGQQEEGQARGAMMLPNLALMTDQQLQAYGVAMNQKFMQFKTRAIQVSGLQHPSLSPS
jgi:hypothetical protein